MAELKTCKECGVEFTAHHPAEKYCSDVCRKNGYATAHYEAYARYRNRMCAHLGFDGYNRNNWGRYSLGLKGDELDRYVRGIRYERKCATCGKPFGTNRPRKLTCSKICSIKLKNRRTDDKRKARMMEDGRA